MGAEGGSGIVVSGRASGWGPGPCGAFGSPKGANFWELYAIFFFVYDARNRVKSC